ncbi:MAG: zinc-dependent metalloprotease [Fimbriimonadaceae bacterium]
MHASTNVGACLLAWQANGLDARGQLPGVLEKLRTHPCAPLTCAQLRRKDGHPAERVCYAPTGGLVLSLSCYLSRVAFSATLAATLVPAFGQQSFDSQTPQRRRGGAGAPNPTQAPGATVRPRAEDPRPIDEVVAGFKKLPGIVTLYRRKRGALDTVYMEVPDSMLGKLLLLQVTAGSGLGDTPNASVFHGMPLDDIPFELRKVDDARIDIMRPNLGHRSSVPEVKRMIARSFPDDVLASLDIRARQADRKSYLVDVGAFFKSDVAELSSTLRGRGPAAAGAGYTIDPAQTYIDSIKNFPENAVIHTVLSLTRRGPAPTAVGRGGMRVPTPKTVPWSISYNLSELPVGDGYVPRLGDPRVGYFTQSFQNLDNQSSRDQTVNYIERWHLEKADPSAALSPPKKPIVFYIDNAVPKEYRDDVRRGLLMWNPAFAALGIKDAIVVKQMPADAKWDIADLRYNVVRWTTGMPFAIALMRANPLTGEMLNASINFDGVFAAGAAGEFDEVVTPSSLYNPPVLQLPGKYADMACDMQESSARIGVEGEDLFESLATAGAPFDKAEYIHQRLAEVVCHEMGHCLGLRHNFVGSTQATLKQLGDPNFVQNHGTSASVMDYVPYNIAALKRKGVDYYQTKVGDYDRFAIAYGYTDTHALTPQEEKPALLKIASQGSLPGRRYLSDGTADAYDPADVRYDFSAEPLSWAAREMQVFKYLLDTASARRVKSGQSYYAFSRSWTTALNGYLRAASYVPRYIGGVNLSNDYAGDPGARKPVEPVAVQEQARALRLLNKYVFGESAFAFRRADLAMLTFNPNVSGNEANAAARLFPIRNSVADFQSATLKRVFTPDVLNRIANNEFRASNTLTLPELFHSVHSAIWSELSAHHPISDLRRQLQRTDLGILIGYAVHRDPSTPDDARALAMVELRRLKTKIEASRPSRDDYTRAHLADCLAQIKQALSAQMTVTDVAPAPTPVGRRGGG